MSSQAPGAGADPADAHETLMEVTNTTPDHPGTNGEPPETFDVVVIGAGSTGTNVAGYARDNGLTVAVIESKLVGGECSYWACMPSKALLGPVHAVAAAKRLHGAAEAVTGEVDPDAVFRRRDEFISDLDDSDQANWLGSIDAELIRGRGVIVGERRVDVIGEDDSRRRLRAERAVVIATGSTPRRPSIDGLDQGSAWDNRDITTATKVPDRLGVLGGGVVGCEMAQAFARLGAKVSLIEKADRILTDYAPEVAELIADAFDEDGITIRTEATATAVAGGADGEPITITVNGDETIEVDELLVAVGRRFNTAELGLDSIGLETDGPLDVDDHLLVTGVDGGWLFAAGDVNGRALLTHQGKYQARCVGDTIAGKNVAAIADHRAVPQVVFTDPEVAAVGLTETDADDTHRVVSVGMGSVAAAPLSGQTRGRASLVIDDDRNVVVGASFVGPDVGEVLHSATIAIMGEVPVDTLWHAVPSFPTISEVWLRLLEADRGL